MSRPCPLQVPLGAKLLIPGSVTSVGLMTSATVVIRALSPQLTGLRAEA